MEGFFSNSSKQSNAPLSTIPLCGACGLNKKSLHPKIGVTGKGKKEILLVVEAPGKIEDRVGKLLVGETKRYLQQHLWQFGIDLYDDCWLTSAVRCKRPLTGQPTDTCIRACQPNLIKTIKEKKPKIIILLGPVACTSLLRILWKEKIGDTSRWGNCSIPSKEFNAWICPTVHPSWLIQENSVIAERMFHQHLALTLTKKNRPWKKVPPHYEYRITIIYNPKEAKNAIELVGDTCQQFNRALAFDYETNCLKPEGKGTQIISCAFSNGLQTIAYPWEGEAVKATSQLLRTKIPKIASNLKFEERWTIEKLGHSVTNWHWDTMLASHVLDNKPGITSIKFQAFTLLGAECWDTHIEPFLKATGKDKFNRIKEINLKDLLLYNGLDALYEYKVATKQIRMMKRRRK